MAICEYDSGVLRSSFDGFHCWLVCDDYAVDFMAPNFEEAAFPGEPISRPRRMFQRPLGTMARSFHDLRVEGDFYLEPNANLTESKLESFASASANGDLVNVCLQWFEKPPREIQDDVHIQNELGEITKFSLSGIELHGAWWSLVMRAYDGGA